MPYYPLFLNLTDRTVVIIGLGKVGQRKLLTLLEYQPKQIRIVDPLLVAPLQQETLAHICQKLQGATAIEAIPALFAPEYITGAFLVFAATDSPAVNSQIATLCQTRGILCNRVDSETESDCIVPASVRQGPLTLAISTGGLSPALSRKLRMEIELLLGKRYSHLVALMGRLRPKVLALGLPSEENAALFRAIVNSPLTDLLEERNTEAALAVLVALLPEQLHSSAQEVLE